MFTATTLSVGEFNMGAIALHQFLSALGCTVNETCRILGAKRNKRRIGGADRALLVLEKQRREKRRLASLKYQRDMEEAEGGASYSAGMY